MSEEIAALKLPRVRWRPCQVDKSQEWTSVASHGEEMKAVWNRSQEAHTEFADKASENVLRNSLAR